MGFANMLADEQILIFLFNYQQQFRLAEFYQLLFLPST